MIAERDGTAIVPAGATNEGPAAAHLAETATKINGVESRLRGIETALQDSMSFTSSRGKDVRDRMQVIEDLLRGQRDTLVRTGGDVWEQKPPSMI